MKNKWKAMLAGVLCLSCLPVSMSVSAEYLVDEYEEAENGDFTVTLETDTFSYTAEYKSYTEMVRVFSSTLETDLTNANCIVTGICEDGYYRIDGLTGQLSTAFYAKRGVFTKYLDGRTLEVGDLLYIDTSQLTYLDSFPQQIEFPEEFGFEYCGNGMEIFGEDFKKVMRYELYQAPNPSDFQTDTRSSYVDKGKVNYDDEIDIVDCIALNKYLLTGYQIGYYAQCCADVDNNGIVNATDSLNLLKYVVGIIGSFEAIQS